MSAAAADISGSWDFTVETEAGSGNPKFNFKQDGEKLTGDYKGLLGEAKVQGKVTGNTVEFSFTVEQGGQSGKVTYTGTIESPTKMKGKVSLGDLGQGTWTATKN